MQALAQQAALRAMGGQETQRHSIYTYIGQRIRERRKQLKLNQAQLAELMGFSYQQMQKYESGSSQISVSRMLQFSRMLNVPATYFYEGARLEDSIGRRIEQDIIQSTRTSPLQIVLIESNANDILMFRKILSSLSQPVEVYVIHEPDRVQDFLRHHQSKYGRGLPDIVITEIMLPKANGLQVIRSIRKDQRWGLVPVIALTNSISRSHMIEAYSSGVSGFIQKRADVGEYIDALEAVIRYWASAVVLPAM